jgi:ABC-type multidrug transport system ATPase subunit
MAAPRLSPSVEYDAPPAAEPVVRASGLSKWYGGVCALPRSDITLERGGCYALFGDNGSGKTTLLRILAGLLTPTTGRGSVLALPLEDREGLRSSTALLGGGIQGYGELTALEMLTLVSRLQGGTGRDAQWALDAVELGPRARSTRQRALSSGEQRRVGWARLLLWRRPLWLLDEPYNGLDASGQLMADSLIRAAVSGGTTVLFATHRHERAPVLATATMLLGTSGLVEQAHLR